MSREALKNLIELLPENDLELIYQIVLKFIPEDIPTLEEVAEFEMARAERLIQGVVPHNEINWD